MRTKLLLLSTLIAPVALYAGTVKIAPPHMEFRSSERVHAVCRSVDTACTTFERTTFSCACELRESRWAPAVDIQSRPLTFISHGIYMEHEVQHVFDFQSAMRQHAAEIEQKAFQSQSECDAFASRQLEEFPAVMRAVVRASMVRRDPSYSAHRK
jgi:hypothetical protein